MKNLYIYLLAMLVSSFGFSQSEITITTSGGSFPTEKWVNITTAVDGGGTQIWGQGDGTQCNGNGLLTNELVSLAPGTYFVNCYDNYDDSWDGTTISVVAYGVEIGNNGGLVPDDGLDTDLSFTCEGTPEELEASFQIIVPAPPTCPNPSTPTIDSFNASSATISWTAGGTETDWEIVVQADGLGEPAGAGTATTSNSPYFQLGLTPLTDYEVWVRADCGGGDFSDWIGPVDFTTSPATVPDCPLTYTPTPDASCGNFDTSLAWDAVAGATNYFITIGTSPGGIDVENNLSLGNTTTYTVTGQTPGTTYYYTVAPENIVGTNTTCAEQQYTTAATPCLCTSAPSSNTGLGISNVRVGLDDFATGDVTYFDHSGFVNQLNQNVTQNVVITFETGVTYDANIWIDFNDDSTFDVSELVFSGESSATNPTDFDASFLVPAAAALGPHKMRIGTANFGQATPDPCYNGTDGVTLDFDVNINAVSCVPATVNTTPVVVPDCVAGTFTVNVTVDDTGTAFFISGGTAQLVVPGLNILGPFVNDTPVNIEITHLDDAACNFTIPGGPFVNDQCPPPPPTGVTCTTGTSSIVFSEEFDDLSAWTGDIDVAGDGDWETNDNGAGSGGTGPDSENSGPADSYIAYEASGGTTNVASAVSPAINLSSAVDGAELAFFMHAFGGDIGILNVGVGTSATGPFTNIWSWTGEIQTAATDPWTNVGLSLDAYLGQTIYVEFSYGGTGGFEGDLAIDSMTVEACGSFCLDPNALTATNITSGGADIGWTANSGETAWEVSVVPTGDPIGTGTATTSNPYTASGLAGETVYDAYVRADCGGGDFSLWVGPVSFTTPCAAIVPTYVADMSTNVPDNCWEEAGSGEVAAGPGSLGASDWQDDSDYALGGSNEINLFAGNSDREWLLSPTFDLSGDAYQLEINVAVTNWNDGFTADNMGSDDEVQLLITEDNGTTWTNLTTWNAGNQPALGGTEYIEDLSGYTGNVQFAIWASDGTVDDLEDYDFHVGQFIVRVPPTCPDVTDIIIDSVTDTEVQVSWTDGGVETNWEVLVQTDGTGSPATGTPTTSNPYTETGLTAETAYEVYVRADCTGGNFGTWIGPVDFTTACAVQTAPYTEDFENAGVVPDCWSLGGDENWLFNTSGPNHVGNGGTLSGATVSGGYYAVVDDSTPDAANALLTSPLVDVTPLTNPALEFYLISDNEGFSSATLTVDVYDGAAWNNVGVFTGNTSGWAAQLVDLGGLTFTGPAQVRFSVADSGEFYDDIAIDDVSFLEGPSCFEPTGFAVNSVGDTTAEIGWVSGGSTSWEIVVQPLGGGSPAGAGTTTTNPYTATGLTPSTDYEAWLRADCGGGTFSAWVGAITFTTTTSAISTFPYDEDFESGDGGWTADNTLNGSWQLGAPANTIINSADSGVNAWVTDLVDDYVANDDSYVISPPFDMSSLVNPVVELAIWYNAEFSWDGMVLQSSVDGGVSWQNVGAQGDPNNWYNDGTIGGTPGGQQVGWTGRELTANGSGGWLQARNNLTGLGGESSVILRVAFGSDGSGQDEGVAFDTVSIFDPLCPDISGLTIDSFGAETAQISWTAGGTETDWEIVVQTDGTGEPVGAGTATTDNPYTANSLTELTAYEVYVRADCGGGDFGNWVGPVDFTTEALCPEVSGLNIDTFNLDSVQVSWTNGGTETAWEIVVQADGTGEPATGTATTTNPHVEGGLTSNTAYEVYVRANCVANGFSQWVGPADFTTLCGPLTPEYFADMTVNVPDACWDEAGSGEVAAGPGGLGASDWRQGRGYALGDSNALNLWQSVDREWLLSPTFDLSTGGPYQLEINVAVTDYAFSGTTLTGDTMGSDDEVQLLVSTDGGSTWTNLTTWNAGNQPDVAGTAYVEDLTAYTGNVQFAVWGSDGTVDDLNDYDFHVGQFDVVIKPACPDVTAVNVTNITTTTADVGWTNGGTETNWEVAIQAQGTGTPAGAGTATASNPYNASGLTAQTDYEVWVRSDCGGGDFSDWVGPVNFSSACNTFALPLVEGFESGVPPQCWSSFRGTNGAGTGFDWESSPLFNSGAASAFVQYENSGSPNEDWLVTPAIDLNGSTNPEVVFFAAQQFTIDYGSTYTVRVSTTDTDIASFTTVQTYTEADLPIVGTDGFDQFVVDLAAYNTDTVYIAFVLENDDGDNFFVDDVLVWDNGPGTYTYNDGVWSPFTPPGNALDDIIVAAGDLPISSDFTCNTMTVNPGAAATVDAGVTLTATNGLLLESSSTSYSSLIRNGSVVGAVTYERHVNINGSGTTGSNDLISAPLTGQQFNDFRAANPNIFSNGAGTLFLFGPFNKGNGTYETWSDATTATLDPGVGYRAATDDNGSFTFVGTDNNGIVTNDIQNAGINNPEWNLIGNPYPSYLNVQNFLLEDVGGEVNINLFDGPTAAIYGYDGSALNGWTLYNLATTTPSTLIAPGQGFMVSADATNDDIYDVEFTPAMRRAGTSDDFIVGRNAPLTYLTLNLTSAINGYSTDFYFNANASQGFDRGYDAAIWGETPPAFSIYSSLVKDDLGSPMTLQALRDTDLENVTIPLGVYASQGEQITFGIGESTLPAHVKVYLDDTVENTTTLLNASDYVMTPKGDLSGTGRFFLRYEEDASLIENSLEALDIFTLNESDELVVSGELVENATLNLFDIQGRLVLTVNLDSELVQNRINVATINAGIYLATVQNNNQEVTKKVIIE